MTAPRSRAPTAAARARKARQSKPVLTITFMGEEYKVADRVGVWPLMQFSRAAESGLSLGDQKGLAAMYAMLQDVIHEDDWGRFQDDMLRKKANDLSALLDLTQQAVQLLQERNEKTTTRASNGKAITGAEEE